jgi:hypothetical protein
MEVRSSSAALSKAAIAQRRQIAWLKRWMQELETGLQRSVRQPEAAPAVQTIDDDGEKLRFRASGFAAHRKRLGLSAAEAGAFFEVVRRRSTNGRAELLDRARRCCQQLPRSGVSERDKPVRS